MVKFVTSTWRLGTGITFYCVMNRGKWNALPPDIQKVVTEVAMEAKDKQGGGGYIFSIAGSAHEGVRLEALIEMCRHLKEAGVY